MMPPVTKVVMELRRSFRVGRIVLLATALQLITAAVGVATLLAPQSAAGVASVPYLVNFQGRLTDNNGNILTDGSYNIKFRIFDASTSGTNLWEGDRVRGASDHRITVTNGLFNIQFGDTGQGDPALSPSLFNTQTYANLYLEVELPTPATATCATNGCASFTEGAMTPRQPLASAPYAFNSDTLDGLDSGAFVQLGASQTGTIHVSGTIQSDGSLQGATATLTGTNSLTLGSSSAVGQATFGDGANSNVVILQSGATVPSTLTLTLPTNVGSSGDCLKDTTGAGVLGFGTCATGTLQSAYNNSTSPATITTGSATKNLVVQSGTGFNSTGAFAVIPDGTSTPTLDVDTQNNRVGVGTATPAEALDVAGGVRVGSTSGTNSGTIRFSGGQFEGYDGSAWVPLNAADVLANSIKTVYKTSDQSLASSTTLQDDTQLKFTIGAGETWDFHMNVAAAGAAGDLNVGITAPAGATCNWGASVAQNTDSYGNMACGASTGILTMTSHDALVYVDGSVTAGASGGTVTLQWSQNTSSGTATVVRAGSYLQAIQDSGGSLNPFIQGGNSFGATAVLGTADANDVSIVANTTEGIHVDTNGNVGVGGITSDGAKLEVNGSIELNGIGAPAVAPSGEGRIYFDTSSGHFRVSESGGSYADLLGVTGANTSLSNLSSVAINAALLTSTTNTLDIGSATNPFASAYFGTGLQAPQLAAANNTDLALLTTGTGNLNLTSGSGTINVSAATIATAAQASLTFDLNSAVNSTLYVTNSNAGHVANLDVSGSLNLGAGQQISVGGSQISSADLSNDASLTHKGDTFNGTSQLVETDSSGHLPALSGQNLTSLDPTQLATGSGAVTLAAASGQNLTLNTGGAGGNTVVLGSNVTTLQKAANALTLDLVTAATSTLTITNSNGANVANLSVEGGLTIGSGQVITVGATPGAGVTCSGGQLLQNQVVAGGVTTGGSCVAAGATTTLSNIGSVAADANISPDATANNRDLGDSTHLWRTGYFGTSLQSPSFTGAGAVSLSSGGTSDLTLDSLSGNLILGTNTTTLQKAANLFTIDLATAATSTLTITNSNGSNVANVSVEGGVDIGSGRVYSVNGTTGLSRTCASGEILDGFTTTGGIITGGTCTALAGDKLLAAWTSQQALTATDTQTHIQFTGADNSQPSFNNGSHLLTLPANASKLVIEVKAGGGGGGSTGTSNVIKEAGGGGEGASAQKYILSSLASDYYFKVGAGGTGGASGGTNNGITGSSSCFGTNSGNACTGPSASAVGGSGGTAANTPAAAHPGGAGGLSTSGVGDITASGAPGCDSTAATAGLQSGCGGGAGGGIGIATAAAAGNPGTTGGGGSGAGQNTASATSRAGGAGGDGYLKITVYTPAADTSGGSSSETLQDAYNLSSSTEFTVDSTNGGLTVRDSSGGIGGNLLEVQDNSGSTTYLAVTNAGISTSGSVTVASGQTYNVGASTGQSSTVSCSAGQAVTAATFTGGVLTTAPTCASVGAGGGATTALDNLASTAVNANISPDATANNRDLGDSTHLWRTGYFGTSLQAPLLTSASGANLNVQAAGTGALTLTSGSGTIGIAAATLQTTGQASLNFDLNDAATSTLYVKNTNGAHVANLDVSGSLNIASGQHYNINGTPLASTDLSNDASLTHHGDSFNGTSQLVENDSSGHLPALSGQNLTSLNPTNLATGSGAVTLAAASGQNLTLNTGGSGGNTVILGSNVTTLQKAANALTLDLATAGLSTLTVSNSNGSNVANLAVSGSIGVGVGGVYTAGASSGAAATCSGGQFLQDQTVVGGITTGGTCAAASGGDLQDAYDASSSPAAIALASGKDFEIDATDQATDPNILFNLECTTSCSTNGRFAVQSSAADVLTVNPAGSIVAHPVAGQDLTVNLSSGSKFAVSAASAPTEDQLSVDNTGTSGVATDNANGEHISFLGGSAAVEAAGLRIDYTPGGTTGSTWSGLRIAAGAPAASGVSAYGLKLEGPGSSGAGTNTAINIATGWDIGLAIEGGGIELAAQADPAVPAAGHLMTFAKAIAGRVMLKVMGPNGRDYPLQPSLFQNQVAIINAQSAAKNNFFGTNVSYDGTPSTPAATENFGYMTLYATTAASGNDSGISTNSTQFFRGSQVGANGFFFMVRGALPDSTPTTNGARIFVGLTSRTTTQSVGSDNDSGSRAGFSYSSVRGDTDWMFSTKDGSTQNLIDTGLPFVDTSAYDYYIYTPPYPNNGTIYWRIDNMTAGTSQEGSTSANLPAGATAMRGSLGIETESAAISNMMMQRMYIESDR